MLLTFSPIKYADSSSWNLKDAYLIWGGFCCVYTSLLYTPPPCCLPTKYLVINSTGLGLLFELTKFIREGQLLNLLQGDHSCFPHYACEGWTADYFYLDVSILNA